MHIFLPHRIARLMPSLADPKQLAQLLRPHLCLLHRGRVRTGVRQVLQLYCLSRVARSRFQRQRPGWI
jgi:hypothetical protein